MRLIDGVGGEVRVGYRLAARLGVFRVDVVEGVMPQRFTLEAAVAFADPFWITQRPMSCTVTVGTRSLRFDRIDPTFRNGALSITTFTAPT